MAARSRGNTDAHAMNAYDSKASNNLDFLRLAAAVLVIVGHCIPLVGYAEHQVDPLGRLVLIDTIAGMAVAMFFCMSGYLVTASFERSGSFQDFAMRRLRRLVPGLVACVLVTIFVIGPLFTTLSLSEYFSASQTWKYLSNMLLRHELYLPGVFQKLPNQGVNGSLWTLLAEVMMYLSIPALFVVGLLNAQTVATLCIVIGAKLWFDLDTGRWSQSYFASTLPSFNTLRLAFMFFVGSYIYLQRERFRWSSHIAIALVIALFATYGMKIQQLVYLIVVPYLTFYLGQAKLHRNLLNFSRFGDFSYGLYLYGFLAQQIVVQLWITYFGGVPRMSALLVCSLVLAFAFAAASWFLVEKRFGGNTPTKRKLKSVPVTRQFQS
jgi:peptidoglycan/LPS O-acetylase OafA/YrhL